MLTQINKFIEYWWFRYMMVTELYIVEKWERVTMREFNNYIHYTSSKIHFKCSFCGEHLFLGFATIFVVKFSKFHKENSKILYWESVWSKFTRFLHRTVRFCPLSCLFLIIFAIEKIAFLLMKDKLVTLTRHYRMY